MNLLKYRDVAEMLHVSENTARRWGAEGKILEVRLGPYIVRVTEESVWQYLAANMGPRRQAAA
jgi:predicted site-specific integrase-resolvase